MSNPLDKLKKLKGRSLKEFQTRGGQAMSAYSEKLGIRGKLLADDEFLNVILPGAINPSLGISAETLRDKFYADSTATFFPSISNLEESVRLLCSHLNGAPDRYFISQADKIIEGRFDLLGLRDLNFGTPVDWHFEPVSETHAPVKHWKQFDETDSRETGDKKIIWELNRHRHFFTLGIAYRVSGDEKYAVCFAEHLNSWMNQNPPGIGVNWVSSLEVAFRVMSWLWAFHLFKDSKAFTPDLFYDALKFLFAQGRHIEKYLSTYYSPNTHLTGEALGLYYLGTQLRFFDRADHWRSLGEEILTAELGRQVRPDGIYFEQSTWYQRYTTDIYIHFMILQKLNGSRLTSGQHRKLVSSVRSLLDSQMLFTRPDGTSPLIGDDDGGTMLPVTTERPDDFRSTLATGAVIFERGDYKLVAGDAKQAVLWLLGPKGVAVFESIVEKAPNVASRGFRNSGFYVMRDGWSKGDNYLLIDAGEVGSLNGGHGHADTLSIELAVGGRTMLVDPGTYTYHKSLEQRNCYRSSAAHNTLTIDEKSSSAFGGTFSWDSMADAEVDSWISQDRFDFINARHNGYRRLEHSPADCRRSILFLKNDYWIMRDFVKTVGEHQYQQNFHFDTGTNPFIAASEDGTSFVEVAENEREGMRLFTFGDNGIWQRKDGWISKCYGQRQNAPIVRFLSKGIGPQEFMTFMIPIEPGFEKPVVFETEVAGGRAFVVNYRDYQDLFVFADGGTIVRTEFFNTDFAFLWSRISPGEKLPEEFVLIDGRNFTLNGREVLNAPEDLEFATARRLGKRLNVRTSKSVFRVSIPQTDSRTFIVKSTPELDI